ncbi:MBL fold metallo-hydrolase [Cryobacterium sp. Y11]|uniref:MBL fold metallo-hydrolase n=1 Tax=Cryobacterium sp. Y11 TaxID=2045016 RepID=UPI00130495FB|nr:MBL fold metallo-hydrolase [Cryobacterium sp. Y11]
MVFINGLNHIGGTQLALRTAEAEIFFDVGLAQTEQAALFNAQVPPGVRGQPLADYLRSAMAPLVDGLYRADALGQPLADLIDPLRDKAKFLEHAPYFPQRGNARAVFVSHLHSDHAGLLPYLSEDQPVHLSEVSHKLQGALERSGLVQPTIAALTGHPDGRRVNVGDIELTLIDTDHDTPGAMGFIAETDAGTVAYTGDWRYHGLNPQKMDAFAELCYARSVDVLVTEASTAVPAGAARWPWGGGIPAEAVGHTISAVPLNEHDACDALYGAITAAPGLVFFCFHQQQLERAAALGAALEASDRRVVVEARTAAFWLEAIRGGLLDIHPSRVLAFEESPLAKGDEPDRSFPITYVTLAQIRADRDSYVCQLSTATYAAMLEVGMGPSDLIIHANGHPLGSQYPGWIALTNWVRQLGVPFLVIDAHGHATPDALRRFVAATGAPMVIPVHSDHPQFASVPAGAMYLPSRWESVRLNPTRLRSIK